MSEYRTREALVEVCDGARCWKERRFIAERKVRFFGVSFWWPVINAQWRVRWAHAEFDIKADAQLRAPLSPPKRYLVAEVTDA